MSYVPKYNISWFTWRETYHSNMQKTARKNKETGKRNRVKCLIEGTIYELEPSGNIFPGCFVLILVVNVPPWNPLNNS